MKVLITGVTGFIGSHIARQLLKEGHEVVGYDFMPTLARLSDIAEQVPLVRGDICDLEVLLDTVQRYSITHVVHLAAFLPEAAILNSPTKAIRINCEGTNNVFEAARLMGVRRVVYASSNAVCPLGPEEDAPVKPTTLYGHLKHLTEVMGRHFSNHFGLETIGLRFILNYGPGGRLMAGEIGRKYGSGAVFEIVEDLARGRKVIIAFPPETDWDWIYVKDNARCVSLALQAPTPKRRIFDVPGERRSMRAVVDILTNLVPGALAEFQYVKAMGSVLRTADLAYTVDPSIIRDQLGYAPAFTLEKGLQEYVDELRRNPELHRAVHWS